MPQVRKATMQDVPDIHRLITYHAELNRMLFRSHADLYEHLRDFFVCTGIDENEPSRVVGCAALELVWRDLAEVKSLAVDDSMRRRGIGSLLVEGAVEEARALSLARVFALTRDRVFFEKQGFCVVPRDTLPHKVWTDCVRCPLQENCDEIAVVRALDAPTSPPAESEVFKILSTY